MADEINREKVEGVENVYSVDYTQDIDEYTKINSDVDKDKVLYYTDLDTSAKAELFTTVSEAKQKADDMIRKFPNHIVKFYMFYYTETYNSDGELSGVKQELCQVVPGTIPSGDSSWDDRYRQVKRKNLKKTYDKIDFITVYRPLNGIKWYTVSKEELAKELAVIKEFYGLTNFPDKVGDFYFSKKIGKWLATDELGSIIAGYEAAGQKIPVIYIDEELENGYNRAEKKTIWELLWESVVNIFKGIGSFLESVFGIFFSKDRWDKFWKSFEDGNNNFVPDNIEQFWHNIWQWTDSEGKKIFDFSSIGDSSSSSFTDFIQSLMSKLATLKIFPDGSDIFEGIDNKISEIKEALGKQSSFWGDLWQTLVNKILSLFGINLDD